MPETIERLVATLDADIRGFTKNMAIAQREFDQRAAQIERRQTTMMTRVNSGFSRSRPGLDALIARYATWSAVIVGAQRFVRETIEVNDQASASYQRLEETLSGLADRAGPLVASFFDGLNEAIKGDIQDIDKLIAAWKRAQNFFTGAPLLPNSPLKPDAGMSNTFNKSTGVWTPHPEGFPVPGVTDVTPKKAEANNFNRMYNESMNQLAEQLYGQFQEKWKKEQDFVSEQYLKGKETRDQIRADELDAIDQFHVDAEAAWARYYEGLAEMADRAAELEQERVADRIAQIGDAFEYLAGAAMHGGEVFKRALAEMASSLAASGLRSLFEGLLNNFVSGGGFLGELIGGTGRFGGARAGGGPVQAGTSYVVGERGPEIFKPTSSGMIVPNAVAARSSMNLTLNQHMSLAANGDAQVARIAEAAAHRGAIAAVATVNRNFKQMLVQTTQQRM